ncbi:MAG: queuosine salvage family protein [Nanoarchaeota archaeon]
MNPALENIKYVVENSKHVSIDYAKLKEFCAGITESDIAPKSVPAPFDLVGADTLSRVDFAVIFNSVNFCYWGSPKWTIEHDGKHYDGAAAMAIALRRAMDNGYPILSAGYLKNMSEKDLRNILEGNVEIPLFGQRLANLKETGRVLSERYDGHFFGWLKRVDNDALRLVDVLTKDISHYQDSAMYKGREIVFNKRAQLAVYWISRILEDSGQSRLVNIGELTDFADYKDPQLFRKKKIMVYSKRLSDLVDRGIPLRSGSEEEVEIRGNCVWVVEGMSADLKPRMPDAIPANLHPYCWAKGQVKSPGDSRYHNTLGQAY